MNKDELSIDSVNFEDYDFIDFGCSNGKSILYGVEKFDGKQGIGIDIDYNKVKQARFNLNKSSNTRNHAVICDDINNISKYNLFNKVKFTICIHFLEHLYNISSAERIIEAAVKISKDFVFIIQPFADKDTELFKHNLKTYYSDWTEHVNLMTSYDFYKICRKLYYNSQINYFVIFGVEPIVSSISEYIHPLNSPINQHEYDGEIHPPKDENIQFEGLYKDIGIFISISGNHHFREVLRNFRQEYDVLFDSRFSMDSHKTIVQLSDCDFVDVGSGSCASIEFGVQKFGGKVGLAIDKDPLCIERIKDQMGNYNKGWGYHRVLEEDILQFDSKSEDYYKKFKFSTCINTVEQFKSIENLENVIKKLGDISTDFAYITHVNHDYDDYFKSIGFKTYMGKYEDNLLMTSDDYIALLNYLKKDNIISDFVIFNRMHILDTSDKRIMPFDKKNNEVYPLDNIFILLDVLILFKDNLDYTEILKRTIGEKNLIYSSYDN